MTKLQPITSEEVLAKQVKERSQDAGGRTDDQWPSEQASSGVSVGGPHQASDTQLAKQPDEKLASNPQLTKLEKDAVEAGYTYRLPLGSYLLAFIYLQIFVVTLLTSVMALVSMSDTTTGEVISIISRQTWITMTVSLALSIFIFSGRNVLKWCSIVGAGIAAVGLGYPAVITLSSGNANAAFSTDSLALLFAIALCVTTALYLLRKKVSAAYE